MTSSGPIPVAADATERERDQERVTELLGRTPQGTFSVVVRRADGSPVVIRNDPLLDDGTPMPTRFWLVDRELNRRIGTLEAEGGVRAAEATIGRELVAAAHERYARERDRAMPESWEGPRPSGGVGGTRRGIKCLHAHYAYFLAGGDDPVGQWVHDALAAAGHVTVFPPAEVVSPTVAEPK